MTATAKDYRYQLPKKAQKIDCPDCGPKHRKTLKRYVDTRTGEPLPEPYGRCDRESNCGYDLNPYHKTASGLSYAEEMYQQHQQPKIPKAWFRMAGKWKRNGCTRASMVSGFQEALIGATPDEAERIAKFIFDKPTLPTQPTQPAPVCSIPDEVFRQSLGHYDKNQFARLLSQQFGPRKALELLQQFHVGTSARWPGACVFWYIDEQNRKRGGQIKLFGADWHTEKYTNQQGEKKSKTSWVHSALTYRLDKAGTGTPGQPLPDWLVEYNQYGECSPCLFGLPQLLTAPVDIPVAIVEAPKTAIICSHYLPGFVWLAVGALSYLNPQRLAPVRGRKVILYPDLNAYSDRVNEQGQTVKGWLSRANELQACGFDVEVSNFLEQLASDEQKQAGLDLADYLLTAPASVSTIAEQEARPECRTTGSMLKPDESQLDRDAYPPLVFDSPYPAEWDEPNAPDAVPTIRPCNFFDWQRDNPPFNQLGLASLNRPAAPT